jgi:hypothetical protein
LHSDFVIINSWSLQNHRHHHERHPPRPANERISPALCLAHYYFPKYSPERNPDEYLNCDVKGNINTDGLAKDREKVKGKLRRLMDKLSKLPARIASYFQHKYIADAAVPEPMPI